MSANCFLRIAAYGCNVHVETDDAKVLEIVDRHLLPTLPRVEQFDGEANCLARIEAVQEGFALLVTGMPRRFVPSPIEIIPLLIRAVDDIVIKNLRGWFAVHAGTVEWQGRAILVPGISHAGKSSLVAALLRRGATYFSDEYALIDADGQVYPYPRPVLLRDGGTEQKPVRAEQLNATIGREPVPVGWVFVVRYVPGAVWKVEAMEQSQAVFTLLQNTPQILAEAPAMIGHFRTAVQHAKSYWGERGDADDAAVRILCLASA